MLGHVGDTTGTHMKDEDLERQLLPRVYLRSSQHGGQQLQQRGECTLAGQKLSILCVHGSQGVQSRQRGGQDEEEKGRACKVHTCKDRAMQLT
eukprot:1160494-Pelagomonas_calceolata.AAC.4